MPISAIAFDLDGTLIDSVHDLAAAANLARADLGLAPLAVATVASYVGDGASSLVARTLADDHHAEYTGSPVQKEAMARFDAHYTAGLKVVTDFYPSVQATLATLHQRYPLAIVTNKPERYTLPLLALLGIHEHFDCIVAGDTLAQKKPAAEPLLHVTAAFNIEPAALLMVGDSKNDLLAARAAGCPIVMVDYGYGDDVAALGADALVSAFDMLPELITHLDARS
ncbi:Phosphoglycolate phosphatase, chromosomal [Andreprevotia sp. IGB-42]|uniref:phosphoglycolate phosphatase n=1 Tax=Andreprevotia sp. IGB-42 TaxID=2497473 RepID=UPI00135C321E|nr:phosphoglycolate phosphatase [Andreprevotia sp. IGB-42]KAF0814119.1 Phosphoglycolate phosphatase, chromosomal [Andreprevotia sp. IGB-42]